MAYCVLSNILWVVSLIRNLAVMSAEERRLAEEEGSLSKNSWQRKKEEERREAGRAPVTGPSLDREVRTFPFTIMSVVCG